MVVTIEKGYQKTDFFIMEEKKATGSYNRKGYYKINFFTMEKKTIVNGQLNSLKGETGKFNPGQIKEMCKSHA